MKRKSDGCIDEKAMESRKTTRSKLTRWIAAGQKEFSRRSAAHRRREPRREMKSIALDRYQGKFDSRFEQCEVGDLRHRGSIVLLTLCSVFAAFFAKLHDDNAVDAADRFPTWPAKNCGEPISRYPIAYASGGPARFFKNSRSRILARRCQLSWIKDMNFVLGACSL